MNKTIPDSADKDTEARVALWKAIYKTTDMVLNHSSFNVKSIRGLDESRIRSDSDVPDVATWQLVEALSLMGTLFLSEYAAAETINIFGKTGPIEIKEDGIISYLWAQQTLSGEKSMLGGRPDLIVTSTKDPPNINNAIRIIEAKCLRHLGAPTIRSEFGKAYDLKVATYLIWSFYTPTARVIEGANGLGIDLKALEFDSDRRNDLINDTDALISHVAQSQKQARQQQRFATALEDASAEAKLKLTSSANIRNT